MSRLYLFRHGLALPHGTPGIQDDDRPLTEKGERRVRQVARGLKRLKLRVETIATSPLPRAAKTAAIVAETLDLAFRVEEAEVLAPRSSPEAIRDWLAARDEGRIMVVGHNPNLSELLSLLVTGATGPPFLELRKAGVAGLRRDPSGRHLLEWITRPRLVRRLRA